MDKYAGDHALDCLVWSVATSYHTTIKRVVEGMRGLLNGNAGLRIPISFRKQNLSLLFSFFWGRQRKAMIRLGRRTSQLWGKKTHADSPVVARNLRAEAQVDGLNL